MIYFTPKPIQRFFINRIQSKEKITEKELFKERWEGSEGLKAFELLSL